MIATQITPNSSENRNSDGAAMLNFCRNVFPNIERNLVVPGWLDGRKIMVVTNKEVASINSVMDEMMPGNGERFSNSDTLENSDDLLRFNSEYLNTLLPNGEVSHSCY